MILVAGLGEHGSRSELTTEDTEIDGEENPDDNFSVSVAFRWIFLWLGQLTLGLRKHPQRARYEHVYADRDTLEAVKFSRVTR